MLPRLEKVVFRPPSPPNTAGPSAAPQTPDDAGPSGAAPAAGEVGEPSATPTANPARSWAT
ncbi:UNVERIFIED_CONTAM: hypothetical protein Slati_0984800 [Sesamum latifolium]|uniref:Uncharacterized protein n=1 Tax=Sesamum latifolium TaxID=2727402 RepID=A0AAW2XRR3_9LAMI